MKLLYINYNGIKNDILEHLNCNKRNYIISLFILAFGLIAGVAAAINTVNAANALRFNYAEYYALITSFNANSYILSIIFANVLLLIFLYCAAIHYYLTPILCALLFYKAYVFAVFAALLFKCYGIAALGVIVFALIPFYLLLYCLFAIAAVLFFNLSRDCYRFGYGLLIYELRKALPMLLCLFVAVLLLSALCGAVTVLLSGGLF